MKLPFLLLSLSLAGPAAMANDSIATVGVGGIVFRKTDAIAMKKEVLNVSYRLITVDYDFLNESSADVEETIVFPLPAYDVVSFDGLTYYGQPSYFSIQADGKPVAFTTVVQALKGDEDVTGKLRQLGLSDAQIVFSEHVRGSAPPPLNSRQKQSLEKEGLILTEPNGELVSAWRVQVNYVWKQKFPVGKVVRVHHAYRPFVGASLQDVNLSEDIKRSYCADAGFVKAHKLVPPLEATYLNTFTVAYILKTGNSWKRGIEDFTLNVIKGDPAELLSLCFPGTFKKIDARTYQVRLLNFAPKEDLQIYFANVPRGAPGASGVAPVTGNSSAK